VIRKKGQRYQARSKDGKRLLGTYRSRKEATERLRQVETMQRTRKAKRGFPESYET
jgi:hypothetical protein